MIDCFAFLFASWKPEFFSLSLSFALSKTCYFFPLYFGVLVLLQTRNPGPAGMEISSTAALKLICIAGV